MAPPGSPQNRHKRAKFVFFLVRSILHRQCIQLRSTRGQSPFEFTQFGKFNHDRMNERDQKDSKEDRQGPKASQFGADRQQ